MDQHAKKLDNDKYGHNGGSISVYGGGEVLTVQVASSIPGACAINGAENNSLYGNGKGQNNTYNKQENENHRTVGLRYRECLKNHAASIGSHAVDGCGEFMPRGAEGTDDAIKCMACGCHRNFHRREADGEEAAPPPPLGAPPYGMNVVSAPPYGNLLMPVVAAAGTCMEHLMTATCQQRDGGDGQRRVGLVGKKRFRTKFTAEQKEKMFGFAEKIGWRIQKNDEAAVQRFCDEAGVRRHVLKVWMHNNKNSFAKKS